MRILAVTLPLVAAVTLAACGDDGPDSATTGTAATSVEATTADTGDEPAVTTEPAGTTEAAGTETTTSGSTDSTAAGALDLDRGPFRAVESSGYDLVEGSEVVLTFEDGNVSGSGGCNTFLATPYSIDGDVLVVEGPLAMTRMMCDPAELVDQDTWLGEFLTSGPTAVLEADRLTLTSGDVSLTLVHPQIQPPTSGLAAEVDGRTFVATEIDGEELVESADNPMRVTFDDGAVSGTGGCNTFGGAYSIDGDVLNVEGPLPMTMMACEPEGLIAQDMLLADLLTSSPTIALDGDTLTITGEDATVIFAAE